MRDLLLSLTWVPHHRRFAVQGLGTELTDSELTIAMESMDADGSGSVDFAEFYGWWEANKDQEGGMFASITAKIEQARAADNMRKEVEELFDVFDHDGSGALNKGEIRSLAMSLGMALAPKALDEAMSKMDHDNSGEVDVDEFFEWYEENSSGDGAEGGMFFSFTQKGHHSRMRAHLNDLRLKFVPGLLFRREDEYKELAERDAKNPDRTSKTAQMMSEKRAQRGYKLQETFDEIDTSGDGLLDKEEVAELFRGMGLTLSTEQLDKAFGEMDADGGGGASQQFFALPWWGAHMACLSRSPLRNLRLIRRP